MSSTSNGKLNAYEGLSAENVLLALYVLSIIGSLLPSVKNLNT